MLPDEFEKRAGVKQRGVVDWRKRGGRGREIERRGEIDRTLKKRRQRRTSAIERLGFHFLSAPFVLFSSLYNSLWFIFYQIRKRHVCSLSFFFLSTMFLIFIIKGNFFYYRYINLLLFIFVRF